MATKTLCSLSSFLLFDNHVPKSLLKYNPHRDILIVEELLAPLLCMLLLLQRGYSLKSNFVAL